MESNERRVIVIRKVELTGKLSTQKLVSRTCHFLEEGRVCPIWRLKASPRKEEDMRDMR